MPKLTYNTIFKHLFCVLMIAYLFGPPLLILPTYLNISVFSSIFCLILFYAFNSSHKIYIPITLMNGSLYFFSIYSFLVFYSFIHSHGTFTPFLQMLLRLFCFAGISLVFSIIVFKVKISVNTFLKYYLWFVVVNSIAILLQLMYPEFDQFMENIVYSSENPEYKKRMRFSGLLSFGGASLSIVHSFYFLFLAIAWPSIDKMQRIMFIGLVPVVLTAFLFSGRTGVLAIFMIIILLSIYYKKYSPLFFLLLFGLALYILSYVTHVELIESEKITKGLSWAVEPLINFFFKDSDEIAGSFTSYKKMIFLPGDILVLLFGDGTFRYHKAPPGFKTSDIGFLRQIFAQGIIVSAIMWAALFDLGKYLSKQRYVYYVVFFLVFFIFNMKEHFLFKVQFFKLYSLFFFLLLIKEHKEVNSTNDL